MYTKVILWNGIQEATWYNIRKYCTFAAVRNRMLETGKMWSLWIITSSINPLNAELIPMCHLLILLGDLTFMVKCVVSISNKMQRHTAYLYLETVLHVSGGTSTHHQECIKMYLQHLVFVIPLLLSDATVEELEPVWVCCGWRTLTLFSTLAG
jgi:hypothetical protein